jgi:hypothetical protein
MAALEHVPQRETWDCGLACAEMALRACGVRGSRVMEAPAATVWTIDLLLLLHNTHPCGDYHYTTTCVGAPPAAHFELDFYKKAPGDAERVPRAFAAAAARGLAVTELAADLARVAAELASGAALFIALVDYRLLRCAACGGGGRAAQYQGHYVVLRGFAGGALLYHDPARASPCEGGCAAELGAFAAAWSAAGPDCDLIRVGLGGVAAGATPATGVL